MIKLTLSQTIGRLPFFLCLIFAAGTVFGASQTLRVSSLFGDNACVQAGRPIAIWGWSTPGDKVSVALGGSTGSATAAADGKWQLQLPSVKAGGPYTLTVSDSGGQVQSQNIVAGEVWLASGQSNMFFPLLRTTEASTDLPKAGLANLRLFFTDVVPSDTATREPKGQWLVSSPESASKFSGVAWYFGRRLNQELGVPVGMIESSLGGTPIEAWLPPSVWKTTPEFEKIFTTQTDEQKARMAKLESSTPKAPARSKLSPEAIHRLQVGQIARNYPSVCYNSGITPLFPYTIAGVIWYQGEWNAVRANTYELLLKTLIAQWRQLWGDANLPFYIVQLPNQGRAPTAVVEQKSGWPALREAQASVLSVPHTGMVVTIDLGSKLLHPPRKKPVGERLAGIVLADNYQKADPASGPVFLKAESKDGKIALHFKNADGLRLTSKDGQASFAIAGSDRKFYPADATVAGDTVIVSNSSVSSPEQVRYLWAGNPQATLYNGAGLPAGPFRTDSWDTVTAVPYAGAAADQSEAEPAAE